MLEWTKKQSFEVSKSQFETWYLNYEGQKKEFEVYVERGKPFDVAGLKKLSINEYLKKVESVSSSRLNLYKDKNNLDFVKYCPVCKSEKSNKSLEIYKASYHQCNYCTHYYVKYRPTSEAITNYYSSNEEYQKTYADKATTEKRIREIALPKAVWTIEQYIRINGKHPNSILDVGTGSGHFVEACNRLGLNAEGIEISKTGINFARDNFGIELLELDFTIDWEKLDKYDIVTCWGIIEHTIHPVIILKTANNVLNDKGIVTAGVPRWNSFGSKIQTMFPSTIIRHLDPLGHINCFTDSSLATALVNAGFNLQAAWYYGMDVYELLYQLALLFEDDDFIEKSKIIIAGAQDSIDSGLLSDSMVFLGQKFNE